MTDKRILRQPDIARKQLALLRFKQQRAYGALNDAAEWQGPQKIRAFVRVRDMQYENFIEARYEAKVAGSVIFG